MRHLTRRQWAELVSALGAFTAQARAQSPGSGAPPAQIVNREMLRPSLEAIGLKFTDAQMDLMLPGLNRFLAQYEALRKVEAIEERLRQ